MLAKIVAIFLVVIAVLGMFGKLRMPGAARIANRKCPRCGRYRIGSGPCGCGNGKG
ncbi:short-chain dehydrogenase [Salipiger aestuarii]|nr:short-chain dehydrogenase [Salipiger aestuarii]KAA8612276.1 short-chain dehydrogenase [Salipiger aestuarii]KAB2541408.1 short-chain dehydrogenase [Salipiger aestuarii]